MKLEDWLDDLCVRFIVNLPHEELGSVERICFQIEEAQWFYEDFIRPLDPTLPSLPLRNFSLLVFQHCPLFAGFAPEFFQQAFAQFLAYKTRVPVRGAILLNENMDHVILVKGWKKSANWSFPRGKINKDERDLDCAIREVYEETGFDVNTAGLVLEESEMKYISVTIREQDVGLYVFRGVPMDTQFEPKTRKEISKIEWWKLSDLPTFRKNRQHEGNGESLAINANKFYMVAPFLNELKKWINFQRRRDAIEGRHLTLMQPAGDPVTATEDDPDLDDPVTVQNVRVQPTPSDLPEVTLPQPVPSDASAHLKALLNINSVPTPESQSPQISKPALANDREKSNALLNLLRRGGNPGAFQSNSRPYTPHDHLTKSRPAPSPHHHHPIDHHVSEVSPPPFLPTATPLSDLAQPPFAGSHAERPLTGPKSQRSGVQGAVVPPASSLPQLSEHAKSLLNAFKTKPAPSPSTITSASGTGPQMQSQSGQVASQHQNNLLDLFRQPQSATHSTVASSYQHQNAPVELAAQPVPSSTTRTNLPAQKDILLSLVRQQKVIPSLSSVPVQNVPAPLQILQRQDRAGTSAAQGFQALSISQAVPANVAAAPQLSQPQILRRPLEASTADGISRMPNLPVSNTTNAFDRRTSQPDIHKKALLSLFNNSSPSFTPKAGGRSSLTPPPAAISSAPLMSSLGEKKVSSSDNDAVISPPERPRMGSTSSFGGIARTTNPSDREFLLQYLGVAKSNH